MISGRLIEDLSLNLGLDWLLSQHTLDRRGGDAVSPGDLTETLAMQTVLLDCGVVQFQRSTADTLTFQTGTPHAGAHPPNIERSQLETGLR